MQESLEGTQAEADALLEESSFGLLNPQHDEGHEERAWGGVVLNVSHTTFAEVAAAMERPFHAWTVTKAGPTSLLCCLLLVLLLGCDAA